MNWETIDWKALERLRTAFLAGTAGEADYWKSESDLASYDATFAQRIGWKWDYVLVELKRRGWHPEFQPIIDWGCGSGIAHRAFLDHFDSKNFSRVLLHDRSSLAMSFAAKRAREKFGVTVDLSSNSPFDSSTVLLSHVLTELDELQLQNLLERLTTASAIIWVEPGTFEASRRLVAAREKLRSTFQIVAPCTHQNICGMLAEGNEQHWCHHFASPPPEVFTDGNWAKFAKIAGVDLRSLPLSFLVLDKRPVASLPMNATRIIGNPRLYKAWAILLGSNTDGVHERRLSKRNLSEQFRELKKEKADVLQLWTCDGDEIIDSKPIFPNKISNHE